MTLPRRLPSGVRTLRRRLHPIASLALLAGALHAPPLAAQRADGIVDGLRLRTVGPATMSGRITDLAVHERDPNLFYAASADGGIWKTTNGGTTWRVTFDDQSVHSIGALALDQRNPDVLWVGTGEATNRQSSGWGNGVHRTTDGGRTWQHMGLRETRHIARIAIDPRASDVVYVASPGDLWKAGRDRGLYKTTDGGRTWTRILGGDSLTGVVDVAIDPREPDIVYAATYQRMRKPFGYVGGGPGSGLHRSTDGGRTWTRLGGGLPTGTIGRIGIDIWRTDPRVVYVSVEQGERYTSSISYAKRKGGVYRSEDKGLTWRFMGDWNPRPSYASQLRIDPSDQSRLYQMQYSVSDDSGKTWREPRQSLHGDDRTIWINPADSRHLIKADDGGVGVSRDRGVTWQYAANIPVSQFYHVRATRGRDYRVCGGLQDNGSWCAPHRVRSAQGIADDDWVRVGGGDGFHVIPDPADSTMLYVTSQYLGLTHVNARTLEVQGLRPTPREGEGPKLGNWGAPEPRVGKKQIPANWNAPVLVSAHDPRRLYAGMRELMTSADRGRTWRSLGDRTTGVDRRTLAIMGQGATDTTLSLDDGVSYFPTISALAESPKVKGLLYVGTDDGNLQRSRDGGATWTELSRNVPGVPKGTWVRHVEASPSAANTAYVSFDGHQDGDFTVYLFRTTDAGQTWTSIRGDLPAEHIVHVIREDPSSADVLWAGTEFGLYVTHDGGAHWARVRGGLPPVPVHDLDFQRETGDVVIATHARGIWILDQGASVGRLTAAVRAKPVAMLPIRAAEQLARAATKAHAGDVVWRGENPPVAALIDLWLAEPAPAGTRVEIVDRAGAVVTTLPVDTTRRGLQRVTWNLRLREARTGRGQANEYDEAPGIGLAGRWATPGAYTARVTVAGRTLSQPFTVLADPALRLTAAPRAAWEREVDAIAALMQRVDAVTAEIRAERDRLAKLPESERGAQQARITAVRELAETSGDLYARVGTLYSGVSRVTAAPTADQRAQAAYFPGVLRDVQARWAALGTR
ncbi:MAG: hypothetical protein MUF21_10915 [Gemmatimonadaceae bacterium]|nr:hypothetical protein [Gemmatimonadaceae bacterium]